MPWWWCSTLVVLAKGFSIGYEYLDDGHRLRLSNLCRLNYLLYDFVFFGGDGYPP